MRTTVTPITSRGVITRTSSSKSSFENILPGPPHRLMECENFLYYRQFCREKRALGGRGLFAGCDHRGMLQMGSMSASRRITPVGRIPDGEVVFPEPQGTAFPRKKKGAQLRRRSRVHIVEQCGFFRLPFMLKGVYIKLPYTGNLYGGSPWTHSCMLNP
jgi:hypothetical protein